jgi:GWxTD domain-containing protein
MSTPRPSYRSPYRPSYRTVVLSVLLAVALAWAGGSERLQAQTPSSAGDEGDSLASASAVPTAVRSTADTTRQVQKGVEAVQEEEYRTAVDVLDPLVTSNPLLQASGRPAAYWLGRAYAESGSTRKALHTWRTALLRLDRRGGFDVQMADAYVHTAFRAQQTDEYAVAGRAYLQIVHLADALAADSLSAADRVIVSEHLRNLAVVLPKPVQERTGLRFSPFKMKTTVEPMDGAGETLVSWWRGQDPLPATRENERLYEHLRRVAYAFEHYSDGGVLDDRGLTYLRFGDPRRDVEITLDDAANMDVNRMNLRDNAFWTYRDVHRQAYYLFVETDPDYYELASVADLFPAEDRPVIGNREQSSRYVFALEKVLRQLAVHSEDYAMRYARVADFAAWQREGLGDDALEGGPSQASQSIDAEVQSLDRKYAAERAENVPTADSEILDTTADLPVYYRISRFLTPSDSTRLEVYWSVRSQDLLPTDDLRERLGDSDEERLTPPYALRTVAAQEDRRHVDKTVHYRQHLVDVRGGEETIVSPRTIEATVLDSVFHVALQWDQYEVLRRSEATGVELGRLLRRHARRIDTLRTLSADRLEMSDLVMRTVRDGSDANVATPEGTVPYPFRKIRESTPLALSFEVYHLTYGANDRTEYTVDYEIRWSTERGGIRGLFGGDEEDETVTTATYEGSTRRTQEHIVIDLAEDLNPEKTSEVEIRVRVTDETTGQSVERSIDFTVVPNKR